MKEHGYTKGRLNLPFVGISTFGKSPYIENWDDIKVFFKFSRNFIYYDIPFLIYGFNFVI